MRNKNDRKIVFVLGAGFSKDAGAPLQDQILPKVLELNDDNSKIVSEFLTYFFGHTNGIPLEDIFTALDRSISRDEALREKELEYLLDVRERLNFTIARVFAQSLRPPRAKYVNDFAHLILKLRLQDQKADRVAIISTNWDILLDNAFGELMVEDGRQMKDYKRRAYIDYCVSDKQIDPSSDIPRSLTIKARGYYNVKLLKLHGSLNWLKCPNCDSLFVEFGEKLADKLQTGDYNCYACDANLSISVLLRPFLISPTFLKDLTNVHSKMSWWNAGFELSEATHVVFIGYSLPLSDFELRYLFARYIWKEAEIKVILYSETPQSLKPKELEERKRYCDFFGPRLNRDTDIKFDGAEDYVRNCAGDPARLFW